MRIALIETAAPDRPGSMRRYADLVEQALQGGSAQVAVARCSVAPRASTGRILPGAARTAWHHAAIAWRMRAIARRTPSDIYHVIDGSHGYVTRWLPSDRTVVTAHDLIPYLQMQGEFPVPPPGRMSRRVIRAALDGLTKAAAVVAVSQSTANDVQRITEGSVADLSVIPSPVWPGLLPPTAAEVPPLLARAGSVPAILHIGNNGFYKNRAGVLRIVSRVMARQDCRLIMAGPPLTEELESLVSALPHPERVEVRVDPTDDDVIELYRHANVLLFPSRYEGYGWPPLEAMAWGCPVVCSTAGSLAEVVGNAALTAGCHEEECLANHTVALLSQPVLAAEMVRRGRHHVAELTLERFASQLMNCYLRVIERRSSAATR
jgi:glycosyltransferase involved in cell wall biosynthesis